MTSRRQIWTPLAKPVSTATRFDGELATLQRYWELVRQKCDDDPAFREHTARLLRRVVIETGQIEGVYSLDRGVTETLIEHGYDASLIGHGDSGPVSPEQAVDLLRDQERAYLRGIEVVVGGMDLVGGTRQLDEPIVRELHAVLTQNQEHAEGRDPHGRRTRVPLRRGDYKQLPNNPTRGDGTVEEYCPPEHVGPQMAELFRIYHELESERVHPVFLAAWFHHAFASIHPFQDGNGRLARLLASIILVKHGMLYLHVERDRQRTHYLDALKAADEGEFDRFLEFVTLAQKVILLDAVQFALPAAEASSEGGRLERAISNLRLRTEAGSDGWHEKVRSEFESVSRCAVALESRLRAELDPDERLIRVHVTTEDATHDSSKKRSAMIGVPLSVRPGSVVPRCELGVTTAADQRTASFWIAEPICPVRGLVLGFAHLDRSPSPVDGAPGRLPIVGDLQADDVWRDASWPEVIEQTAATLLESLTRAR
jgi:Fic family protein